MAFAISCTEPFEFDKEPAFESALVVEASLTDQNSIQRVILSRSFPLDTVIASGESGAQIEISDDTGRIFNFNETNDGNYVSSLPFAAEQGRSYTLSITTADGSSYVSEASSIRGSSTVTEIYAIRELKDEIEDGIFIYLDSFDPDNQSNYYRYEYEETYQIIAPFYVGREAFVVSPLPNPEVGFRTSEAIGQICYTTDESKRIIQTSTVNLAEDRVSRFPVRFINSENYIISHRYSILVKQYVQSIEAFTYYETLETLSGSESLFSQIQTGFIEGNIRSQQNNSERVIGFFEVASVSEKRLFFNYEDLFPDERLPDYLINCSFISPQLIVFDSSPLIDAIEQGTVDFFDEYDGATNPLNLIDFGPYLMTQSGCGDCTQFGSIIAPDFWEE